MVRLPDDIEEYLLSGQLSRATPILARRRGISFDRAQEQIDIRVSEMLIEAGSEARELRVKLWEQCARLLEQLRDVP